MHIRNSLRTPLIVALTATVLTALTACSGSDGDTDAADPAALLTAARASLDGTDSAQFTLTSTNVPGDGTRLVGGEGVVARPNSFQGKLGVQLNGSKVSIDLISTGGKVYAKLPFSNTFTITNPADFGLSDPANLIDPKTGISRMFGELTGITNLGDKRIGDDVVTELDGSLPGALVDALFSNADPAQPVQTKLYITKSTKQLRRADLTGPFFDKTQDSTFTVLLDKYGAPVTIAAPTTS